MFFHYFHILCCTCLQILASTMLDSLESCTSAASGSSVRISVVSILFSVLMPPASSRNQHVKHFSSTENRPPSLFIVEISPLFITLRQPRFTNTHAGLVESSRRRLFWLISSLLSSLSPKNHSTLPSPIQCPLLLVVYLLSLFRTLSFLSFLPFLCASFYRNMKSLPYSTTPSSRWVLLVFLQCEKVLSRSFSRNEISLPKTPKLSFANFVFPSKSTLPSESPSRKTFPSSIERRRLLISSTMISIRTFSHLCRS